MGKRELIALLNLSSWCLVMVERLFLAVPRGCLQFVIVVFPDHTHLLFFIYIGTQLMYCVKEKKTYCLSSIRICHTFLQEIKALVFIMVLRIRRPNESYCNINCSKLGKRVLLSLFPYMAFSGLAT